MQKISVYEKIKRKIEKLDDEDASVLKEKTFALAMAIARTNTFKISEKGKILLYDLLIEKGFDIHSQDKEGNNIYRYTTNGFENDYFFEKGVSITHKNVSNVMMATYFSHYNLVKCLNKKIIIPEDEFCDKGTHPFFERKGRVFVKVLNYIKNKNMVNQKGENIAFYTTPQKKIVEQLLETGVDFNLLNKKHENILFKASVSKIKLMMELNINVDVNHKNSEGEDPFDIAIKKIEVLSSNLHSNNKELVLAYRRLNMLVNYAEYTTSYFPANKIMGVYQKAINQSDIMMYKSEFEKIAIGKQLTSIMNEINLDEEIPKPLKRL